MGYVAKARSSRSYRRLHDGVKVCDHVRYLERLNVFASLSHDFIPNLMGLIGTWIGLHDTDPHSAGYG